MVGILGVTHDPEMQETFQYPLSLMQELIQEFAPDVICGEVHSQSWRLYRETGHPYGVLEKRHHNRIQGGTVKWLSTV